jgi:hypothetical protein
MHDMVPLQQLAIAVRITRLQLFQSADKPGVRVGTSLATLSLNDRFPGHSGQRYLSPAAT